MTKKNKKDLILYLFEGELARYVLRRSSSYPILYGVEKNIDVTYKKSTGQILSNGKHVSCIPFKCKACSEMHTINFKSYKIKEKHSGDSVEVSRWIDLELIFQCSNCLKQYKKGVDAPTNTEMINVYYPDYNLSAIQFNI